MSRVQGEYSTSTKSMRAAREARRRVAAEHYESDKGRGSVSSGKREGWDRIARERDGERKEAPQKDQ
jgi:hypothetical protein